MDTVKIDHGKTRMIAHRGLSGIERENTHAAFVAAGNRSYFGIETDVHKTVDGRFVIIHDEDTRRVSEGAADIQVEQQPFAAMEQLRLPDRAGKIRRDLCLPMLEEYIRICKQYDKVCVLELKNAFTPEDIGAIVEICRQEQYLHQVIFISFVLENCVCLRRLLPRQPIQRLLCREVDDAVIENLCRYRLELDCYYPALNRQLIARLHGLGIQVNGWTCDDPVAAAELIDAGIDFITTNILE